MHSSRYAGALEKAGIEAGQTVLVAASNTAKVFPSRGRATQTDAPACVLDGKTYDHAALSHCAARAQETLRAGEDDVVWGTLPVGTALWFSNVYVAPWSCGVATVIHDAPFRVGERLSLVRELNVAVLMQPVEEYAAQVRAPEFERFRAPRLPETLVIGAADSLTANRWNAQTRLDLEDVSAEAVLASSSW